MSDTNPTPGKSLESDLRLIRESKGLSREDVFNRVHIRPEVLAQVEEYGFKATPTLNSDIHRRSFVKHYADAVGIDSEFALRALETSVTGLYDGSLAVKYLGLDELKPIPRWAQGDEEERQVEESDAASERDMEAPAPEGKEEAPAPERKEEVTAPESKEEAPAPEGEEEDADAAPESEEEIQVTKLQKVFARKAKDVKKVEELDEAETEAESKQREAEEETGEGLDATADESDLPEFDIPTASGKPVFPVPETEPKPPTSQPKSKSVKPEPSASEPAPPASEPEPEPDQDSAMPDEPPASKKAEETELVSPYAPPMPGRQAPPAKEAASEPPVQPPEVETEEAPNEPEPPAAGESSSRRREPATIPSSTLKESVIGPLDEEDLGDEVSFWMRLRGRHWLGWLGLIGVVVVILAFVIEAIVMNNDEDEGGRVRITSVAQLPDQFSGIVRLSPTTERFVTLQITPDSASNSEFVYKIWTHSAGSTFAETGIGTLNTSNNQVLLGEPYGVGGLFVLENGRFRLRSVRRVRFPRWEFTGHAE